MTELKPCPFCGAQPEQWEEDDRMWRPYFVGCTNVDCLCDVCVQRGSEEEAVADWNTRADDYKQAAEYWQRMYEETFSKRTCHDTDENPWHFTCSACGYEQNGYEQWNYCPNCGARVVGGDA